MKSLGHRIAASLVVVALLTTPATAQFASPVGSSTGAAGQRSDAPTSGATQVSVPQAPINSYRPDAIDAPPPDVITPPDDGAAPPQGQGQRAGPPPANEYERFVSTVAGKPMRRFGTELLLPEARGFAVPSVAAVPQDYRLNPGDELLLGLTGSVQASNLRLTIDPEGRIFIPRVGAVRVGGVRYGDVHGVIEQQVARQYRGFGLDVSVGRLRGLTVYVTGFAAKPGAYNVGSLSTLVNAVLAAGGPASGGSFRSIQLRRDGKLVSDFDLYDLLLRGDRSGDAVLQNGDVLYIAPAGDQVAVTGSVNREAIFEIAPEETLADVLLYAGGISTVADGTRLMMLDSLGRQNNGWTEVSAADAAVRNAQRGDVIRVLSNIDLARPMGQQSVLVTISGEVGQPGRYYFKPGTRLEDVVAMAGGLTPQAFPYASIITRESVKHQQRQSFDRAIEDVELLLTAQPATSINRAQMAQPGSLQLVDSIVDQLRRREPTGRLVFDLPYDSATLPADLIMENNDTIHIPPQPVTVGVFGAVPTPASFAYRQGATIGDYITLAGGVQKLGDKGEIFIIRANGTVLADGWGVRRAPALPGDLVYVPIEGNRGEFWARLRDITSTLFGGLVGVASIQAIAE
ncbi:capsule biosynthesis protein [Altererythrobacter xixiisoli]|uniref:Capsule biosynthesis protein n=1 Tax=Croceibacterium xixiisoli TaxID=1476466 RepID=A0A6I4TTT8_9SPHN|nr:SLBB domain-containing protein [Croceibacterium xixiisoli]MXO98551.1 capsule biosynthesis protein [Croceibacterium xixiisoli]